jgi:predicted membrane channel-forming protein YqfA (hemolysin III family)
MEALRALWEWNQGKADGMSMLARAVYPFSASITLGASSLFHTCNCVSQSTHKRMRTVDFVGISGLIIGTSWYEQQKDYLSKVPIKA